jgi:hypothetical protein
MLHRRNKQTLKSIKKHKYNIAQGLLEKSKLAQDMLEKSKGPAN